MKFESDSGLNSDFGLKYPASSKNIDGILLYTKDVVITTP
jgi:hypothetical protein